MAPIVPGWKLQKRLALAAIVALGLASGAAAQSNPDLTLTDAIVTLSDGQATASDALLLEATGLDAARMSAPLDVKDLAVPSAPPSIAIVARELDGGTATRRWLLTVDAKGLDGEIDQQRYLALTLGDLSVTRAYQLVNAAAGTFGWKLTGPSGEISLRPGDAIDIGVAVTGRPATDIRLMSANLVEDATKQLVSGGWRLCDTAVTCDAGQSFSLKRDSANSLKLVPMGQLVGKYTGIVTIGAHENPEGDALSLTIYGTAWWLQALGVAAILIGVVVAWFSSVWAQNLINRAQLQRPLLMLGDKAQTLRDRVARLPAPINAHTAHTLAQLDALTSAQLLKAFDNDGLVPPAFPLPRATADSALEDYKTALAEKVERCRIVGLVVDQGFEKLVPLIAGNSAVNVVAAADALDTASEAATADDASTVIGNALGSFDVAADVASRPKPPGLDQLSLEIRRVSMLVWVVFGLLATALGAYAVVFSNPGFGLWGDFLLCLFWGFGLPVTAQQVGQATIANAGASLGIPMPRAS